MYKFDEEMLSWNLINSDLQNSIFLNRDKNILLAKDSANIYAYDIETKKIDTIRADKFAGNPVQCAQLSTSGTLFVGTNEEGILSTKDMGETWTKLNRRLSSFNIKNLLLYDDNKLLATTPKGIFFSDNGGNLWAQIDNALLMNKQIELLYKRGNSLFAGTVENGLFACDSISETNVTNYSGWVDSLNIKKQKETIGRTYGVKFSADGSRFFTLSRDNFFRIWDTKTGVSLKDFYIDIPDIQSLDYNEKENILIVCAVDRRNYSKFTVRPFCIRAKQYRYFYINIILSQFSKKYVNC